MSERQGSRLRLGPRSIAGMVDMRMFEALPCKLALAWPGGRLGAKAADVSLTLHDLPLLLGLARGQSAIWPMPMCGGAWTLRARSPM